MNSHLPMSEPRGRQESIRIAVAAALLAAAMQAQAQEPANAEPLQEVVVTGFRESLAKALEMKRASSSVVDTIVAEDIAKFPDNNLAESIQRVPGVAISRDQGEGRQLSVRGLGSDFTRVRINGMETQTTTDGLAGGVNRGRGFDFNVFASELFSRIDVRKTSSADVPEGSLGATVDLSTSRPFDFDGFRGAASVQASYNDLSENTSPRAAFLLSDLFADDTLGALVSVAYSKNKLEFETSNSGGWNQGTGDGGFCAPTSGTGGMCDVPAAELARAQQVYVIANSPTTYNPRFIRYVNSIGEIERLGVTASLQWRPSDATLVSLDGLFSRYETAFDHYTMEPIGFSRGAAQGGKPETIVRDIELDENNTAVYGVFDNVDMRSEHNQDEFDTKFTQITLSLDHEFSERLAFHALLGQSTSKFRNFNDVALQIDRFNVDGFSYDLRTTGQNHPAINYNFDVTNPANWYFGPRVTQPGGTGPTGPEIRLRPNYTDNDYKTGAVDLTFALNDNLKLRGGVDWKEYEFAAKVYRFDGGEFNWPAPTVPISEITEQFCGLRSIGAPAPTPRCWTVPNYAGYIEQFNLYGNTGRSALSTTNAAARGDNRKVTEEDIAGFLMLDYNYELGSTRLRGNLGGRFVRTDQTSVFYTNVPVAVDPSGFLLTTVDRRYDDFLPSLNVAFEPTDDIVIRFAAAKVMARPPLANIAAATSVSVAGGSRTVSTGNTNLEPYRAKTYDVSFEWYPDRGTLYSLGFFYKDISTYVQNLTRIDTYASTGLPESLIANTGASLSDDFAITNVINTPGGPLKGFEVNIQQPLNFTPALEGLGVLLNYTRVESEIDYFTSTALGAATVTADLLNLSKNAYNATLYFERGPFQIRGSLNYRDQYLRAVPGPFNVDVAGVPETTFVDFSTSYDITPNFTVSLEGLNLTDEEGVLWVDSQAQRQEEFRMSGRFLNLGLRYTF
jgi:iron complex outermembrane receptor protein